MIDNMLTDVKGKQQRIHVSDSDITGVYFEGLGSSGGKRREEMGAPGV